jgi:hypothetical protein
MTDKRAMEGDFYVIPEKVLMDFKLSANEIRLYGFIWKLIRDKGEALFLTREVAEEFKVTHGAINLMLRNLKARNHITTNTLGKKCLCLLLHDSCANR